MGFLGQYHWIVRRDGTAYAAGTDFGNGNKPITLVDLSRDVDTRQFTYAVFKIPGGSHFVSRGNYRSHGGEYIIVAVEKVESFHDSVKISSHEITRISLRASTVETHWLIGLFNDAGLSIIHDWDEDGICKKCSITRSVAAAEAIDICTGKKS